jgi:hypothetical protein
MMCRAKHARGAQGVTSLRWKDSKRASQNQQGALREDPEQELFRMTVKLSDPEQELFGMTVKLSDPEQELRGTYAGLFLIGVTDKRESVLA